MPVRIIAKRARFFLAVEGESERSFVRWLLALSDERTPVHLHCHPLNGGGFKSMLENAVRLYERDSKSKGAYRERFLIVDSDRAEREDWSIDKLRAEAAKHKFIVCVQRPKHEGLLYRMMPGKEHDIPSASSADSKLRAEWSAYQKPANAYMLRARFSIDDLLRVARVDPDLKSLLSRIGLM